YIDGGFPPPPTSSQPLRWGKFRPYFEGVSLDDPMVMPAGRLDVLAKFPPTLLITGSRAIDMSPAIYSNSRLLKAGVDSRLIVGEGLGHCYIYQPNLPESQDAYEQIIRFFRKNLG
ncbi:MAG TPA: alpha/beta hydrolase fold domain-containing protein, partial [Caulobacteraceae bacterium]|nr:alpha/beta hydrolase fold domain-containing protein [Caulobacteraceae bacterium]